MRILFVTTFYPPHVVGGWEQLVEELHDRLRARGHVTHVLTSRHGVPAAIEDRGIDRVLHLEADIRHYDPGATFSYRHRVRQNLTRTRAAIARFQPDVVFVHIMWNLSRGVPWMAERLCPGRVVYYVADHWLSAPDLHTQYWEAPATSPWKTMAKRTAASVALPWTSGYARRFPLRFSRVLCVSRAIRDELARDSAIDPVNLTVAYNGIDLAHFDGRRAARSGTRPLSLLVAGSLVWHKGVDTAVRALEVLRQRGRLDEVRLTIAGTGHPEYERQLRDLVGRHGLGGHVEFVGRIAREAMPSFLSQFDVLVFPSRWEEPLARAMQEAMAMGLVVIGTPTGGTPELLVHGDTGLMFPVDSAEGLATQVATLLDHPRLAAALAASGARAVRERFDICATVDNVERELERALAGVRIGAAAAQSA